MVAATPMELTEAQWTAIAPLIPPKAQTGRPRADDRKTINGILWALRTGAGWADIPEYYGAPSTCHLRLQTWRAQGIWKCLWEALLFTLDDQERLVWNRAHLDNTSVSATKK